jgi:hypothetical protein
LSDVVEIKHRYAGKVLLTYPKANLAGADLTRADLAGADLAGADLTGANLTRAYLAGADLAGADLTRADLTRAYLAGADLAGANLTRADLDAIKKDFFEVLSVTPAEVPFLRKTLVTGRIAGTAYEGECRCLVGTIAEAKGCDYRNIPGLIPDASRPAERWFLAIRRGRTPENHPVAAITLGWIDEFLATSSPKAVAQ